MLKHRPVAVFFGTLGLLSLVAGRYFPVSPLVYLLYLFAWSLILFCGCYFIGLNYFIDSVNDAAGTTDKVVALSFDDGPAPHTAALLDILKDKKVEAAFFCIGRNLAGRESIIRRVVNEGHVIGNHSFSHHPLFDLFLAGKMQKDVQAMSDATMAVTGVRPVLFRPPFGVTNPTVAKIIKMNHYTSVGWNLRSYDTIKKDPADLRDKILRGLKPGGIILLHDTAPVTLQSLALIIDDIRAAGYRLERLDKMCNLKPYA